MTNAYRLKLSDGTTTVDLLSGNQVVRMGGLNMPMPKVYEDYVSSPFMDGERLAHAHFGNRTIDLTIRINGASQSALKTNVRQIEQLLNDAEKRTLLGYGAQVYLEYQWGNSDNQSTYFDVLRGNLTMPSDYLNHALNQNYILNAQLSLTCKPFGRYANQDITQDTLENVQNAYSIAQDYDPTISNYSSVYGADWEGVVFTASSGYTTVAAAIKCTKLGTLGTATYALYATSAGLPTGAAIASGTIDLTKIFATNVNTGGYYMAVFTVPVALSNGVVYALVVSFATGDGSNYVKWSYETVANGGTRVYSSDSGANWAATTTKKPAFAIFTADTKSNYQDVTTTEAYGDVPAKIYLKLAQTGATGSKKIWIAKRSGVRQADDLWIEGEDWTSSTVSKTGQNYNTFNLIDAACSCALFSQTRIWAATVGADTVIGYQSYTLNPVPRGQFRVLAKVKVQAETHATQYNKLQFGLGWVYGSKTYTPSDAKGEYLGCAADSTYQILDFGILNLPPTPESSIATNASFELRMYLYATLALTDLDYYNWDIDYIFLFPLDEGVVIINNVADTNILALDGISDPTTVLKINGSNVIQDYPDYIGSPFMLGRESTRIYVLRDDANSVTFASDLKYQPQYMVI